MIESVGSSRLYERRNKPNKPEWDYKDGVYLNSGIKEEDIC